MYSTLLDPLYVCTVHSLCLAYMYTCSSISLCIPGMCQLHGGWGKGENVCHHAMSTLRADILTPVAVVIKYEMPIPAVKKLYSLYIPSTHISKTQHREKRAHNILLEDASCL